jgi:hypothetical protein
MRRLLLPLLCCLLAACPTPRDDDDDDSAVGDDDDAVGGIIIPDPGDEDLQGMWLASGMDVSTPEVAFPAGIVATSPDYIEADTDATGNAFYVFEAGADFDIVINLWGGDDIEWIHMHDGDGLLFGDELAAIENVIEPGWATGTWTVEAGHVYVFEVHLEGIGYF